MRKQSTEKESEAIEAAGRIGNTAVHGVKDMLIGVVEAVEKVLKS